MNRASKQFPGETYFTGTGAITYFDLGGSFRPTSNSMIRVGVVNAADKDPPTYRPNVQSGTDPSLFDIYGRRVYTTVNFSF